MSDKTATNLFMFSPLTSKYAGFYQGLLRGVASYQQLGNRLIQLAEQAHAFRQFDRVREIGQLLSNIPTKDYQAIGYYFLAVAANSMGNGDQDKAQKLFELVVENAPQYYRAKAILSLAAISAHKADFDSELCYILEGLKAAPNLAITISAHRGIAIVKAKEGYHRQALKDLERIQPFVKFTPPLIYFDYLNSYAVELGEAGRKYEARNIMGVVLASPFAYAYPEWRETAEELKPPNRSFVVPDQSPPYMGKLLSMPVVEQAKPQRQDRPAKIINLQAWKKKMGKDDDDRCGLTPEQLKEMTPSEKLCYILNSINPDFTDEDFDRVIDLVDEINDKKKK
jgi:tetratricopeptide (TPR) repeat protein